MSVELSSWDLLALAAKFASYVGCFVAIGSALYLFATSQLQDDLKAGLRRIIVSMAAVGLAGSLAQIVVQAGRLLDDGISGMVDPEMIGLVSNAPLGTSVLLRVLGLAALTAFALRIPAARWFGYTGALLTASSFSFVGHATGDPRLVLAALVTLHLLGVSFWIGALWPLRKSVATKSNLSVAGGLAHEFGRQAMWVVGGLVVAGSVLAFLLVGSPLALISSQYGLTLLLKLAAVAVLLALAAANKIRFVPALRKESVSAAGHLRKSISLEMAVVALILAITAVLTTVTSLPNTMDMTNG
ncbi:copper resistance D family protein [Pseudahrensia aquimaris]|uniref:Copper resistance D family protein n=1 Tax=Pseudahrensia aquimaris TaxID=744461 RepID=A0ABW3FKU3_9HYPH